MLEIEVKILDVDVQDIKQKLISMGAVRVFQGDMDVVYFDCKDKKLEARDGIFRLRSTGVGAQLTLKFTRREKAKIAEETEVEISDFEETREMFRQIGLVEVKEYTKHRESYVIEDVHFELDTLEGIPTFLEIEAQSVEEVFVWVRKMGFTDEDAKPWRRREVLEYYGKA
ncbi:class IV adenylate cyclase [Patescibacteria group bacterium]|nr:class IV adenylate cyclase [Patescibacteria group bacterium]